MQIRQISTVSEPTKQILDAINNHPLISPGAVHLVTAIQQENHSLQDLASIIEQDTTITAEVLKIANGASYGLRRPVETIRQGIVLLGERELFRLAIHACTGPIYNRALPFYEKEKGVLWAHSLKTGLAARHLARHSQTTIDPDVAFTGGIMADIGKTVIGQFLQKHRLKIIDIMGNGPGRGNFILTERQIIGTDHCQVGGALAKRWQLPDYLCACIGNHHFPSKAPKEYRVLTYVVHLAETVAMMSGGNDGIDCLAYPIDENYHDFLDVSFVELAKLIVDVNADVQKMRCC